MSPLVSFRRDDLLTDRDFAASCLPDSRNVDARCRELVLPSSFRAPVKNPRQPLSDAEALCTIGEDWLQSGSSELKNWIAAAGALFETDLTGDIVDYQPCYRSEAGTGTANGFVYWN